MKQNIYIYKGTNKGFTVSFSIDGTAYTIKSGDILTLNVRDYRNNDSVVITKTITGSNHFLFTPSDTQNLGVGFYIYNIKFTEQETGKIYQIIGPSTFWIKAGE